MPWAPTLIVSPLVFQLLEALLGAL